MVCIWAFDACTSCLCEASTSSFGQPSARAASAILSKTVSLYRSVLSPISSRHLERASKTASIASRASRGSNCVARLFWELAMVELLRNLLAVHNHALGACLARPPQRGLRPEKAIVNGRCVVGSDFAQFTERRVLRGGSGVRVLGMMV